MKSNTPILISACLVGEPCRFDGSSKERSELLDLLSNDELIPVCPEVEGGLGIPRPPAEIVGEQVLRASGEDVTREFQTGAEYCRDLGLKANVKQAILKSRSPACGCGEVYDGNFSRTLVQGDGIFTQSLKAAGLSCVTDEDFVDNFER